MRKITENLLGAAAAIGIPATIFAAIYLSIDDNYQIIPGIAYVQKLFHNGPARNDQNLMRSQGQPPVAPR